MNDVHDEHAYELTNLNLFIFEGNSVALPFGHSGMTIHGMMPRSVAIPYTGRTFLWVSFLHSGLSIVSPAGVTSPPGWPLNAELEY